MHDLKLLFSLYTLKWYFLICPTGSGNIYIIFPFIKQNNNAVKLIWHNFKKSFRQLYFMVFSIKKWNYKITSFNISDQYMTFE